MASVNNFISTLSGSLKLSSTKCLDFDSEIEIQGYIHLSIDKEKQLRFVVNEHILRQSLAITCVSKTVLDITHLKQENIELATNKYLFDENKDQERIVQISQSAIFNQGLVDDSIDFPEECDDDSPKLPTHCVDDSITLDGPKLSTHYDDGSLTLDGPKLSTHCNDDARKESLHQISETDQGEYLKLIQNYRNI